MDIFTIIIEFISASDEASMPDTLGHAVGAERFELLAKLKGIEVRKSKLVNVVLRYSPQGLRRWFYHLEV